MLVWGMSGFVCVKSNWVALCGVQKMNPFNMLKMSFLNFGSLILCWFVVWFIENFKMFYSNNLLLQKCNVMIAFIKSKHFLKIQYLL